MPSSPRPAPPASGNLSLDLIFAAPGQGLGHVERDVSAALAHAPDHVSAYELTLEPGTPFAIAAVARQARHVPDERRGAEMHARAGSSERLAAAGLPALRGLELCASGLRGDPQPAATGSGVRCSASAWARVSQRSRRTRATRTARAAPIARALDLPYLARIEAGRFEPPEREALAEPTARAEAVFLALRTREGLDARAFAVEFGAPPRHFFASAIGDGVAAGQLMERADGDLALSDAGWLFADEVASRFV